MLESWIVFAVFAAFFQNLRSALQKHLKGKLSNNAAAYARFLYALPFAFLYLLTLIKFSEKPLPTINATFFLYCLSGSVAQIIFTILLLWMFSFRSFAVGTTFSKLEVFTVAIIGAAVLQDTLNPVAIFAILISTLGVLTLTAGQTGVTLKSLALNLRGRDTIVGLTCAIFLGASVVFFRGAALALNHTDTLITAAFTLTVALVIQTVLMGIWIWQFESGQWRQLLVEWRWGGAVGIAGALASIGWFTAFTLQNAGFVRAVGQIELIFTYLFSVYIFREKVTQLETVGILLVGLGILILLLFT